MPRNTWEPQGENDGYPEFGSSPEPAGMVHTVDDELVGRWPEGPVEVYQEPRRFSAARVMLDWHCLDYVRAFLGIQRAGRGHLLVPTSLWLLLAVKLQLWRGRLAARARGE